MIAELKPKAIPEGDGTNYKRYYNTNGKKVMGLGQGGPVMMSDQVREVLAEKVDQTIKTT